MKMFNIIITKGYTAMAVTAKIPIYLIATLCVFAIRVISVLVVVRIGSLVSSRLGHFALNTELYLCEYDEGINRPTKLHVDLFFFKNYPICNEQLSKMWKRDLIILPRWILAPVTRVNRFFPGSELHEVGTTANSDRDVLNLLVTSSPHLQFSKEEEALGTTTLTEFGVPEGAPFVCLIGRDSEYLEIHTPESDSSYHNYRDVSIGNYVLAAEELANRGYYVFRMGAYVKEPLICGHPMVVDYASNGMRSDFMDIYLGAKCAFCVTCGTGFDAVPQLFRKPVAYVNHVPLNYLVTYDPRTVAILKHHVSQDGGYELSLREIIAGGLGSCLRASDYASKGVLLVENTPEEIRDLVIEMDERLKGTWQPSDDDQDLQQKLWDNFGAYNLFDSQGRLLHGEIKSLYGASMLRENRWWVQ